MLRQQLPLMLLGLAYSVGEVLLGALRLLNTTGHDPIDHGLQVPAHDH